MSETFYLNNLSSSDLQDVSLIKRYIMFRFRSPISPGILSDSVGSLLWLLSPLFRLAVEARDALKNCFRRLKEDNFEPGSNAYWMELDKVCDKHLVKYLDVIIDLLDHTEGS